MKYKIIRTDTADALIHNIILNIADKFGADVALEKLDKLEADIRRLSDNPRLGEEPRYPFLRRQGYRALILDKDIVFYKIDDEHKLITIYAVFDQRQDYVNIMRGL